MKKYIVILIKFAILDEIFAQIKKIQKSRVKSNV